MIVVTIIISILALICFLKTKKIKELYKTLERNESMFMILYEQKFETVLKLVNKDNLHLQESLIMDIAEMRKDSLFNVKQKNTKLFIVAEEKIDNILKKIDKKVIFTENNHLSEIQEKEYYDNLDNINNLIEQTKLDYNNMVDHFNQETSDFFGKQIIKQMKNMKKFQHF